MIWTKAQTFSIVVCYFNDMESDVFDGTTPLFPKSVGGMVPCAKLQFLSLWLIIGNYVGFIDFQPRFLIFLDSWMVGFLLCELHDFVLQYGMTICSVPLEINALMIGALPRWVDFYLFYLDVQEIIYDFKLSNVYLLEWTDYVGLLLCKLPVFTIWGITKFLDRVVLWNFFPLVFSVF